MPMKNPPHPGLTVKHDCIEPLGLTVGATAEALGVSRKQLSALINGRAGVSAEMALRLAKAFGGSALVWLRMQAAYDLAAAERAPPRRVKQARAMSKASPYQFREWRLRPRFASAERQMCSGNAGEGARRERGLSDVTQPPNLRRFRAAGGL